MWSQRQLRRLTVLAALAFLGLLWIWVKTSSGKGVTSEAWPVAGVPQPAYPVFPEFEADAPSSAVARQASSAALPLSTVNLSTLMFCFQFSCLHLTTLIYINFIKPASPWSDTSSEGLAILLDPHGHCLL